MPPPVLPKTIAYRGIFNVTYKTFTTVYPNLAAWDFAANSLTPMEFHGFISGGLPVGLWAQIINGGLASPYTNIKSGDNTPGNMNDATFSQGIIQEQRLAGFGFGGSGDLNPQTYSLPAIDGTPINFPTFTTKTAISFPTGVPNTGAPLAGLVANIPYGGNLFAQYGTISLVPELLLTNDFSLHTTDAGTTPDLGISNMFHGLNARYNPVDKLTYINSGNPADATDRTQLETTNFSGTNATKYLLTYVNPTGTINIDDLMTQHANQGRMYPNFGGFGIVFKNAGTIDGISVNGFAVQIAPDYSSYIIFNLIPIDGNNYNTNPGENTMKLDASGNLIIKNVNGQTTLYISSGPVLRTLPVYPPFPMPGRKETDAAMLMVRSNYNGE